MANNPKKVKDPTEVALSAIQEALNISDVSATDNDGSAHSDAGPANASATPAYSEPSFDTRPGSERAVFEPVNEPRAVRRAANDDRETIGQILQAIQKGRPARRVYTFATAVAGLWIVGCILLTVSFLPALQAAMVRAAACWCSAAWRRCSWCRSCCSISLRALPGAARKCG